MFPLFHCSCHQTQGWHSGIGSWHWLMQSADGFFFFFLSFTVVTAFSSLWVVSHTSSSKEAHFQFTTWADIKKALCLSNILKVSSQEEVVKTVYEEQKTNTSTLTTGQETKNSIYLLNYGQKSETNFCKSVKMWANMSVHENRTLNTGQIRKTVGEVAAHHISNKLE